MSEKLHVTIGKLAVTSNGKSILYAMKTEPARINNKFTITLQFFFSCPTVQKIEDFKTIFADVLCAAVTVADQIICCDGFNINFMKPP